MQVHRASAFVIFSLAASAAAAQTSIGPNGIRSGGTVIDSSGVHTATADVGSHGVRTHGSNLGGQTIVTNGRTRSIDCVGKALTLAGNGNQLTLTRCPVVQINGNSNVVMARFDEAGRIAVNGNRNKVSWSAPSRVRVSVSDAGTRNSIARR